MGRGKENFQLLPTHDSAESETLSITVGEINIPALKKLGDGGGMMKPRDHNRGRRGAIVTKLSPGAPAATAHNVDYIIDIYLPKTVALYQLLLRILISTSITTGAI